MNGSQHLCSYFYSFEGPSNNRTWKVECKISGEVKGIGFGATKFGAKQIAAGQALEALGLRDA
jgi:dsRNA-specific ribonuclease